MRWWSATPTTIMPVVCNAVLDEYPDARVVLGPDVELQGGEVCRTGEAWTWDRVRFEILHPASAFPYRGNNSSCVLKITTSAGSMLLTGDVEAAGERALLVDAASLASDVVVVPHHGSGTSSSLPLVTAIAPDYAVVSAGHRNHWGFPKPQVVERWAGRRRGDANHGGVGGRAGHLRAR